jgi:hypothetical protein
MALEENGHGSYDSGIVASSLAQSQDQESTDSSSAYIRGDLGAFGNGSPLSPRKELLKSGTKKRTSYAKLNGESAVATGEQDGHTEEDLWSSILNSVKSSRAVPVKQVIILGEYSLVGYYEGAERLVC